MSGGYSKTMTELVYSSHSVEKGSLFTEKMYNKYDPLHDTEDLTFVFSDATTLILPPSEDFNLVVKCQLIGNRFVNKEINIQGLEPQQYKHFNFETLNLCMWELGLEAFGFNAGRLPIEFSDSGLANYNKIVDEKKRLSKKEVRQLLLAVKYLHFVDLFQWRKPISYFLANQELVESPKALDDFYAMEKGSKKREQYERKANALRVDISSISKELFVKEKDKGTIGGKLTKKALDHLEYYIEGQLRSDKKKKKDLQEEINRIGSLLITSAKGYS